MMQGIKAVCPSHLCSNKDCTSGRVIGGFAAVAYRNQDTKKTYVFHIGCAPPRLRKAYYDRQRAEAS